MDRRKLLITPELGTRLKEFRNQFKVKAKDVAEALDKSAAYISKLEKGEIQQIDKKEFIRIVDYITSSNEGYDKFFEYVSDLIDEKELEDSIFYSNFDWIERKLPLPEELITYINEKLEKNNYTIEQLVNYINKNDDIESTFFDEHKIDKNTIENNIWYPYTELDSGNVERAYIWMHLTNEDVEEVLQKKVRKTNYLTIYVILYHIYKLEEIDKRIVLDDTVRKNVRRKTEEKLHSYKFYTLVDKRKKLSQAKGQIEVDNILSKFDNENRMLTTKLIECFSVLSDFDVDYTNMKLRGIINNFEKADLSFAVAFMAISLEKLNDLPHGKKRDFLKGVSELIEKYSSAEEDSKEFEKY